MNATFLIATLVGSAAIIAWRFREVSRPVTARRIVIPPLGMSTGFSMFAYAPFRVPVSWALISFAFGALVFSYPLIKTSKLVRQGDVVMLRRSPMFLWILLGLVAVRLLLRGYIGQYIDPQQTAGLFFVLAFGMIVVWRSNMFVEYRKVSAPLAAPAAAASGDDPSRALSGPSGQSPLA
jgi:membrane protein CcdC involved in cytochrome C biogenesis